MSEESYHRRFKACGTDVQIAPNVFIEHPENWIVGDRVRIRHNLTAYGQQKEVRIGSDVSIYPNLVIQGSGTLQIGDRVTLYAHGYLSIGDQDGRIVIGDVSHFAPGYALYGGGTLEIGQYVAVAAHTVITTVAHDPRCEGLIAKSSHSAPIRIDDNVWIGANATILPGVRIASGCVIAAGAVLTKSTEPDGIYLGVPARRGQERGNAAKSQE